ncbi:MAG: sugar ABC transporter ATP-binding protein, partial [Eubacteriales bacterium]|nr:sugar ABC transporter ATP-binding protein [Eubacteriales bacterium]
SLNDSDAKKLLDLLLRLKGDGISSIIISHKLNEIRYCADKITIIRDGRTIETLDSAEEISEDRIIRGMVGRQMTGRYPARERNIGEVAMEIRGWNVHHALYAERKVVDNVSLNVRRGEVVGIAGLVGSGRTELCMSVFGHAYGTGISGRLFLGGKEVHLHSIPQAVRAGLAYVTEDRKGDGLILSDSIKHNITLSRPDLISRRGVIDEDVETEHAKQLREQLGIKAETVDKAAGQLSGGNQQKVLLAKWICAEPDILMLDEPTRGVDVGAKYEIYEIINRLVGQGKSVLLVSSELPEILGMCDRIYVMNEGRILAEMENKGVTQETIMGYIMQDSKERAGV